MSKISCIIPAYNEGPRIGKVIKTALESKYIDEIIVINDGSKDNTREIVRSYDGINFIDLKENVGKSKAVVNGFKEAKGKYLFMLDSDLIGLDSKAIDDLILPIINNEADITISLRKNSLNIYKHFNLDFVSGERIFKKDLIEKKDYDNIGNLPSFGLEVYLNNIIINNNLRIKSVYWKNVETPRKSKKYGFVYGIIGDTKMILQVIKTIGLIGIIKQFKKMRKLLINKN